MSEMPESKDTLEQALEMLRRTSAEPAGAPVASTIGAMARVLLMLAEDRLHPVRMVDVEDDTDPAPEPDPEPQGWWTTDQWVLIDRKDPKYLKGGEIYFSQYEASMASAVPAHGSSPTTAAIKSGRITPLSDALTALAQDASEDREASVDEEAKEAVKATVPDKRWVVVEGKIPGWIKDGEIFMTKKGASPLYEGEEVIDAHLKGRIEVLSTPINAEGADLIARYMYARLVDETSPETLEEYGVPQWRGTSAILDVDVMQWLRATREALALLGR